MLMLGFDDDSPHTPMPLNFYRGNKILRQYFYSAYLHTTDK